MRHWALFRTGLLISLALPALAADDRVEFGRDIVVEEHETLTDAVCIGCSIRIQGTVTGDAVAIGGNVDVNGPVRADAVALGGNLKLGPNANIGGDAVALGGRIERDSQARVARETVSTPGFPIAGIGLAGLMVFGLLAFALVSLGLALLCYAVAGEQRVHTVAETVRQHGLVAFLAGLAGVAGAIILFVIASLTGPATPFMATAVSLVLFVALVVGYAGLSTWIGRGIARTAGPVAMLLLGAVVITILQAIPVVNLVTLPIFMVLALGSAIVSGLGTAPNWLSHQITAPPRAAPPHAPH